MAPWGELSGFNHVTRPLGKLLAGIVVIEVHPEGVSRIAAAAEGIGSGGVDVIRVTKAEQVEIQRALVLRSVSVHSCNT